MTTTVYCPECEAACSETDPTCPLCGHQLQKIHHKSHKPTAIEQAANAVRSVAASAKAAGTQVVHEVGDSKPAARIKRTLSRKSRAIIAACNLLAVTIGAFFYFGGARSGWGTEAPLTLAAACYHLEQRGWVFKEESFTFVRGNYFTSRIGDVSLGFGVETHESTTVMGLHCDGRITGCEHETSKDQVYRACKDNISSMMPDGNHVRKIIERARANASEPGGDGLRRLEGRAVTHDGWRITFIEYLTCLPGDHDNAWLLLWADRMN